jgi:hypothetical protein
MKMNETISAPGLFTILINFFGYYVPLILLASWAPLALYDLLRRSDIDRRKGTFWTAAIVGLPFIGAFAYHVAGRSSLPPYIRNVLVFGGTGLMLLLTVIASLARY